MSDARSTEYAKQCYAYAQGWDDYRAGKDRCMNSSDPDYAAGWDDAAAEDALEADTQEQIRR